MFADAAAAGMPPFQNAGGDCNDDKAVQRLGKEEINKIILLILIIPGIGRKQAFKQMAVFFLMTCF